MSNENSKLRADLAISEEKLSERTHERDDFELRLIESEHELTVVHAEFTEASRKYDANLATLSVHVSQAETQLQETNKSLTERTKDLEVSRSELQAVLHERKCFVAALDDLRKPITSATQILEYVAAGKVAPERQAEILTQIVDANKRMLSGAERLAEVVLQLSQRTSQLEEQQKNLLNRMLIGKLCCNNEKTLWLR